MCIVCIANNINRNVYMYLNTRIFSDYWLRTSVVINVYKARARRNGYRMFISVYILCFASILVLQSLDGEERAGYFALFVFLESVIVVWFFLTISQVCLLFVIVVFPDHTHYVCVDSASLASSFKKCKVIMI